MQVIQFHETASSSTYCNDGDTLIEGQALFMLVLQLDLFIKVRRSYSGIRIFGVM